MGTILEIPFKQRKRRGNTVCVGDTITIGDFVLEIVELEWYAKRGCKNIKFDVRKMENNGYPLPKDFLRIKDVQIIEKK